VDCSQQVGAGSSPVAITAALNGLSPTTTYTVTLVAESAAGAMHGSAVQFTTSAISSAAQALAVAGLRLSPARFRIGKHAATISKKTKALPTATTISFALSGAATVALGFEQAHPGVLVGHKCAALSKTHRAGKRCTRYAPISHGVSRVAQAGSDRLVFDGILDGGSRLAPGSYRLLLTATAATSRATAGQHPTFTLLG
jgi:hypothetical protein